MSPGIFRVAVVALLCANLAAISALLLRPADCPADVSEDPGIRQQLIQIAEGLQSAYNASDSVALYRAYGREARAKLTQEKVAADMAVLQEDFGRIATLRYLNLVELGAQGRQRYIQAHFSATLDNPSLRGAQLVLHVIEEDGVLELYGMRLHAAKGNR